MPITAIDFESRSLRRNQDVEAVKDSAISHPFDLDVGLDLDVRTETQKNPDKFLFKATVETVSGLKLLDVNQPFNRLFFFLERLEANRLYIGNENVKSFPVDRLDRAKLFH